MVIFAWIKGIKDEQETHFMGSIESDPIDFSLIFAWISLIKKRL